ncbi:MAG: hypothetical protein JJW01_01255 [Alphaproteobacteria bacterium]|nr:hypothetical protein [Rickettsiales bacterium]
MCNGGFHKNRHRVGKMLAVMFLIFTSYNKRDLLEQMLQTSQADNNLLQNNTQQIIVQDQQLFVGENMPFMKTVDYHLYMYNKAFIIYQEEPSLQEPIAFCGTQLKVKFKEETLDQINSAPIHNTGHNVKSAEKILLFISGQQQHGIFEELQNEIPYARKGDVIYACKNIPKTKSILLSSEITCQSVEIKDVMPQVITEPPIILYISAKNKYKTKCNEIISLKYDIKTIDGKKVTNGQIKNINIGNGQIPIQIEQALLRIGIGDKVVLKIKPNHRKLFLFHDKLNAYKTKPLKKALINKEIAKQDLIFSLKRIT